MRGVVFFYFAMTYASTAYILNYEASKLFISFCTVAILSALSAVLLPATVPAVFFLIITFISSAFVLILVNIDYLAMVFITIYVGAIAVFFLFIIMMIDNKENQYRTFSGNNVLDNISQHNKLQTIVLLLFLFALVYNIWSYMYEFRPAISSVLNHSFTTNEYIYGIKAHEQTSMLPEILKKFNLLGSFYKPYHYFESADPVRVPYATSNYLYLSSLSSFVNYFGSLDGSDSITTLGQILYNPKYILYLIVISVILLVAMILAIVLTLETKQKNINK